MYVQKLETAINQTPISSIGRKDPLPFCAHVAYECMALCVMNVNVNIKKSQRFSKKEPYVIVRMQRNNNPLLGAMFGFNNSYVATFNLSLTVPQKEWEEEGADINEFYKRFSNLVDENIDNFKFYDFPIEELSDGLCKSVLINDTKQVMSTRRVLSLTDEASSFAVAKQNFKASVLRKRYRMLTEDEARELFEKRAKEQKKNKDEDDED